MGQILVYTSEHSVLGRHQSAAAHDSVLLLPVGPAELAEQKEKERRKSIQYANCVIVRTIQRLRV